MSSYLQIQGLNKAYVSGTSRLHVLVDLELELEQGGLLIVTGASGSGKSTLLHLIGAMDRPDSGSIRIGEQRIEELDLTARAAYRNSRIGFVFQFHHLLPEFTALENVLLPLLMRRVGLKEARSEAEHLLDQVGLQQRGHHRPGELSGGEQQRVAVARALIGRPRLLLADEPTGDLDDATSLDIHHLLLEMHQEKQLTSIIVTHDLRLAQIHGSHMKLEEGRLHRVR